MSFLDTILQRNKEIAARQAGAGKLMPSLPGAMPNVRAAIIGCADMRVDPANLFGLEPGEAVVIRNIGGRVTPGLLEELGLLGRIGAGGEAGSGRWRGVSFDRAATYGLRDYAAGGGYG